MDSPVHNHRQNDAPLRTFRQPPDNDSMIDLVLSAYTQKRKKNDNDSASESPIPEWSPSLSPEWKLVKNQWVAMKKWIHANPKQADRHLLELVLLIELMAEEKINPPSQTKPSIKKKPNSFFGSWIGFFIIIILVTGLMIYMSSMDIRFL